MPEKETGDGEEEEEESDDDDESVDELVASLEAEDAAIEARRLDQQDNDDFAAEIEDMLLAETDADEEAKAAAEAEAKKLDEEENDEMAAELEAMFDDDGPNDQVLASASLEKEAESEEDGEEATPPS